MRKRAILAAMMALVHATALGEDRKDLGEVAQFYSYRLKDAARFREGYRAHLAWHARVGDRLVWYAWTVQSGARRGLFIDGTAGAHWVELDDRPRLAEDAADFALTAGPHAEAVDIETWELWRAPSTATPLEDRRPSAFLDVFLLEVAPREAAEFERAVNALAGGRSEGGIANLTWYRRIRGGLLPAYMVVLSRLRWTDIGTSGTTLQRILAQAYDANEADVERVFAHLAAVSVETWSYEPRLSLIPGETLPPWR